MSHSGSLYAWLDRSQHEIRLIRVEVSSGDNQDQVVGELGVYSLYNAPEFDALSYAWGARMVDNPILINSKPVFVTLNLYECLRQIRDGGGSRFIWVDAICINQRDFAERSHQVTLMRDIFSRAEIVHVWLGPSRPDTERTLYVLDRAGRRLAPDFEDADLLPSQINGLPTAAFEQLFDNTWWTRLWVVQEVVLAKLAVARFGAYSIPFSRLLMGILACFRLREQNMPENTLPFYMMQLALKFSAPMTAAMSERPHMKLIPDILAAVRDSKVSVRHDRIYGLLGLLPVRLAIQPDYGRRLDAVFTEFTLRVIWHEHSLDVLALGGLHEHRDLDLPSWVPSYGDAVPYLFRGTSGFDASRALALQPQIRFPDDVATYMGSGRLSIWVYDLCEISFAISVVPEDIELHTLAQNSQGRERTIDRLQQRACECVVKLRAIRDPASTVQDIASTIWSALVGATDLNERNDSLCNDFKLWLFLRGEEKYQHRYDAMIQTLLAAKSCPLFASRDGTFVGIVSGAASTGDMLSILAGACTPCILRRAGNGHYQYVGHTFCIGAMHGEPISQAGLRLNVDENNLSGVFQQVILV